MIFNTFDPNRDVVAGRTTRVASGFWPSGVTDFTQSVLVDDFWSVTGSGTPSPSYGTSYYDVRKTMYYLNLYPGNSYFINNDPYMSIAYGNIAGDVGSGSFLVDSASIKAYPSKTIYTQYKNLLLGSSDLDGMFTMQSASTTLPATDIWVVSFSAYKMKDRIDEGLFEISISGSNGQFTFIDNSPYTTQAQLVYQIITGSLASPFATPTYEAIGLLYPSDGIAIFNAAVIAEKVGIPSEETGLGYYDGGPGNWGSWWYTPGVADATDYTYNHKTFATAIKLCRLASMKVRKSEYIPARHYFIRVMNRDFNYSNNPTYIYDGTDGIHAKGTIRNADFINDPKTYITTVGLYNDSNELVAVAKLSRPAVKSFDQELLIKVRLDF